MDYGVTIMLQQLVASKSQTRKNVKRELCLNVKIERFAPFCIMPVVLSVRDVPKKYFA